MLHLFLDVLKDSFNITCLVMLMLLIIECINVGSSGKWMSRLQGNRFSQVLLAVLLGLIPGCAGGFAIVSMFTHRLISFGALVAGMIATFGDEAFVVFAYSPKTALWLCLCLFVIGVVVGLLTDLIMGKRALIQEDHLLELHPAHEHEHSEDEGKRRFSFSHFKNISFPRAALLFGLAVYIFSIFSGGHEHSVIPQLGGEGHHDADEWEHILFVVLAGITLLIVLFSSEHFLQSHLWEHVIKKHFLQIFLWTFGVLLALHLLYHFVDVNQLVTSHQWALPMLLLLAVLIGIIPESGPHLVFVVLYFSGAIPFSILLASSIVQDGHGALPLLAESKKHFFLMKAVCVVIGLAVGLVGLYIN